MRNTTDIFAVFGKQSVLNMDYDTDYLLEEMNIDQTEKQAYVYYSLLYCVDFMGERGMWFGDKRIDVNEKIISRLNRIYDKLIAEWNCLQGRFPDSAPIPDKRNL